MLDHLTDTGGVLTSRTIEKGTQVNRIDGIHDLRNQSFISSLIDFEGRLEITPDVFCRFDLRSGGIGRRSKRTWIARGNPRDRASQGGIACGGQDESQMTVEAPTKGGRDRGGICLQLCRKSRE